MPAEHCPHCNEPLVTVRRQAHRAGHGKPLGWVRPHPTKPDTSQAHCGSCGKVWDMPGVKVLLFRAA